MDNYQPEKLKDAPAQAQETIDQQNKEIESLRKRLERERFARELSKVLTHAKISNIILSPFTLSRLLEMVVSTATQVIAALSGSLFLIDEEAKNLIFEVAIGPAAHEAKKFRVPPFGDIDPESQQNLSLNAIDFSNWVQNESPINIVGRELALLVYESHVAVC